MSSGGSRVSNALVLGLVVLMLGAASLLAARWVAARGYTLYYGDAEAHLNIARRVLDSRTPGPEQLGTVWLPLPHLLMIPFVMRDDWWHSGVAGAIPSAACFVLAGTFFFAAARRVFSSAAAGFLAAFLFAFNPNLLYLQATPMTEPLFFAALAGLLWSTVWFRDSPSIPAVLAAAAASNAASLTRYEGWFLIPFAALYCLIVARKKWHAVLFGALAALGPLAWLAHNQFYYSNALEFYNGPYSAAAIYRRQLAAGMAAYPGDHDWGKAILYYCTAVRLAVGVPTLVLGAAGMVVGLWRKQFWPLILLALTPAFYVWSIHSSGTPIFVPNLWPFSWYNTRYAMAALPLATFAAASLTTLVPRRARIPAVLILLGFPVAGWALTKGPVSICFKESEVNSEARRAWTRQAAQFLEANYRRGSGIAFPFGDMAGVLREAGIPFRDSLHEGNHPAWDAAFARPELFLREEWLLAYSGDAEATALLRAHRRGLNYLLRERIIVKGAPVVEIYQRQP